MSHVVKNEVRSPFPPDLYSEEIAQSLKSSKVVEERIRQLMRFGDQLHVGRLSPDDMRQALEVAYSALLSLKNYVSYDEYCEELRLRETMAQDAILAELREIPPYEPPPVPDWLRDLQVSEV